MMTLGELVLMLERNVAQAPARLEVGLHAVGALVQPLAAEYIGHERSEWPPLAESTVAEKTKLGYVGRLSATDPGLRTGEMRDSIEREVRGLTLVVGSKSKKLLWFELGRAATPRGGPQPPRPVLALAMQHSREHAEDVFGEVAMSLLAPASSGMRHLR